MTRSNRYVPPVLDEGRAAALEWLPTSLLSDNLDRLSGVTGLRRYNQQGKLVGSAFTVRTRSGDNLFVYKALSQIQPGHVLVIDGDGDTNNALVGELMKLYAAKRGCRGFVIDGAIRDVGSFADFPCYARGNTHKGPYKSGPGQLNVPVSVGGQVVTPGDIVVGDEDGVVTFPSDHADRLIDLARAKATQEDAIRDEIESGRTQQSWLDEVLQKSGLAE